VTVSPRGCGTFAVPGVRNDLRRIGQGECSTINDSNVRRLCTGACGEISGPDIRRACQAG